MTKPPLVRGPTLATIRRELKAYPDRAALIAQLPVLRTTITGRWELRAQGKPGAKRCALCELHDLHHDYCKLCIIGIVTDQRLCHGTPFYDWDEHPTGAKRELAFLRRLERALKELAEPTAEPTP